MQGDRWVDFMQAHMHYDDVRSEIESVSNHHTLHLT
jgi:hypothetical protein